MDKINLEIEGIKEQMGLLADRLEKLGTAGKDEAGQDLRHYVDASKEYIGRTMENIKEKGKTVKESASRSVRNADNYAHENPWTLVAGAVVVGMLLGMVVRSKRD